MLLIACRLWKSRDGFQERLPSLHDSPRSVFLSSTSSCPSSRHFPTSQKHLYDPSLAQSTLDINLYRFCIHYDALPAFTKFQKLLSQFLFSLLPRCQATTSAKLKTGALRLQGSFSVKPLVYLLYPAALTFSAFGAKGVFSQRVTC